MTYFKRGALVLLAVGLIGAAPAPVDMSKLGVLRDVKPGLWTHSFTTIPKNPAVPNSTEKGCVPAAQLQQMLRESLAAGSEERLCPMTIEFDGVSKASFTLRCQPVKIPELGVDAPGGDLPGEIIRSGREDHWVVTVRTPAVPGKVPAATWRHDYRRLGDCAG